jgi:phosphate-selective porin OprO/OprP
MSHERNMKAISKQSIITLSLLFTPSLLLAQDVAVTEPDASLSTSQQLDELEQRQRILERKWELAQEDAARVSDKSAAAPKVEASNKGFRIQSADGKYQLGVRLLIQADGRFYLRDKNFPGTNQFILRRVRPNLQGKLPGSIEYRLQTDFSEGKVTLLDAFADLRPWKPWGIRAGKFKAPVGLERLQSPQDLLFAERGLPTQLVPNRDIGVQVFGDLKEGLVNYAAGVFNGVIDGGSGDGDNSDEKDFAARIFTEPLKDSGIEFLAKFGAGIAGTLGNQRGTYYNGATFQPASNLPAYKTPGNVTFFKYRSDPAVFGKTVVADGTHRRLAPQGYYYFRSFGLLGEYVVSEQRVKRSGIGAALQQRAWTANVGYLLTGEEASAKAVVPKNPISEGGYGAWQVVARAGNLTVDKEAFPIYADPAKSFRSIQTLGAGLNWYATANYRAHAGYEVTSFKAAEGSSLKRDDEHFVTARVQASF